MIQRTCCYAEHDLMLNSSNTKRISGENVEVCRQRVKRGSVGTIGTPRSGSVGSPSARTILDAESPAGSCSDVEVGSPTAGRALKVPHVAVSMQQKILTSISSCNSKEALLDYVAKFHMFLDPINLVTCLYRLARMSKEASRGRAGYLQELQRNSTFQLLLRTISSMFLQGHLNFLHSHSEGLKGVDGRCLANLTWALAKLDLSSDDSALTTELAITVAPFIIRNLDSSSAQGLANMLWSYAKLPVAPPYVVNALIAKITDQLVLQNQRPVKVVLPDERPDPNTFDAQALSNSIWALAHLKSRGMEVDVLCNQALLHFVNELAAAAARALAQPPAKLAPDDRAKLSSEQQYLKSVERQFSCQALVNIAWSFATLLGVACCQQTPIHQLFLLIHQESLTRLQCTSFVLRNGHKLPYVGGGGFNEQALSNAVYAFEKVGLLSRELLAAVFEVSALRLQRGSSLRHTDLASFKPQELCTLLKACHANIAPPWTFLGSLLQLLSEHPTMADSWTTAEKLELHKACQLYLVHQTEAAAAGHNSGLLGVAAATALANNLANSLGSGVGSGPPSGRLSYTGSSVTPTAMSSSVYGNLTGRVSGGAGASGPPSGSLGGVLASLAAASPRSSYTSGVVSSTAAVGVTSADIMSSSFGQPPVSSSFVVSSQQGPRLFGATSAASVQQQLAQQQQLTAMHGSGGVNNGMLMQLLMQQQQQQATSLTCPVCGAALQQQEALAHVQTCVVVNGNLASFQTTLRQQQQQQAQQRLIAQWAAQQQYAQQQASQAQQLHFLATQLQQQQQVAAAGTLGIEGQCRSAAGIDAAALGPWMVDAATASRPPLRPIHRP